MKLLIAIPALNEEQSIESIIQRSLDARDYICRHSKVTGVEITVVSDGSTDRTVELAQRHTDRINLIAFEHNRGYGAAIKEAWRQSDAELLGFLDADGTCDPRFFASLCTTLDNDDADVVLGCRMHRNSRMPLIRRLGNFIFATLLGLFSSKRVRDTASGMRVIRRRSLSKLQPLPDGLHFTPAMSARALLDREIRISEIDMPYQEREGESKLRVGKDGLRFLRVILEAAFLYRPARPLALAGAAFLTIATLLMITPVAYYLSTQTLAEWMIYRFIVSHLLGFGGMLFLSASYVTGKIVDMTLFREPGRRPNRQIERFLEGHYFWLIPAALLVSGGVLVIPSLLELVRSGATYEHWSRFIGMSFLWTVAFILIVTRASDFVLQLLGDRLSYLHSTTKPVAEEPVLAGTAAGGRDA